MGKISFDRDDDNLVTPQYSEARGPVLRSEKVEVTKATSQTLLGHERILSRIG